MLSVEQQKSIYDFVQTQVPPVNSPEISSKGTRVWAKQHLAPIAKTYFSGPTAYPTLQNAIKKPENFAERFKINPGAKDEIEAARRYLKIVISNPYVDMFNIERWYEAKEASLKSQKHQLLSKNDPVQKLPKNPAPIDVILANTHFLTPQFSSSGSTTENGVTVTTKTIYEIPREEARAIIKDQIYSLWESKDTKHVMEALGTLIQKEKGHIFIGRNTMVLGELGAKHGASGTTLSGLDFYNNHHSIYLRSMICPQNKTIDKSIVGSFVHETLHFLFSRIIQNDASPVAKGDEPLIDEALHQDRIHRSKMNIQYDDHGKKSVYSTLVTELEKEAAYFTPQNLYSFSQVASSKGFDEQNTQHRHIMRVEAIVRVMEQIAQGISHEDVKAVAPNLYKFYFEHAKPLIEKYTEENKI